MTEVTATTHDRPAGRPPQATPSPLTRVSHGLLNLFSSVKLAVILLILLAAISIIGTIIAQGEDAQENIRFFTNTMWSLYNKVGLVDAAAPESLARWQQSAQTWGVKLGGYSHNIGFDRLYHTWYFNLLLVLLSLNLIVCSLRHWPHTWRFFRHPKRTLEGEGAAGIPLRREFTVKKGAADAVASAQAGLAARGYRAVLTEAEGGSHLFAQKGIWGRLGVYVVHSSILVILIGAVLGLQYGKKGFVAIEEGNSTDEVSMRGGQGIWKLPFQVRCDNFEVTYYADGRRPKDYKSQLTVIDGGKEVLKKTIEVNSPLIYQGIFFYQSSFGDTGRGGKIKLLLSSRDGSRKAESWLRIGDEISVPELKLKARVMRDSQQRRLFFPDFDVQGNRPVNKSNQPNNPAAYFRFTTEDGRIFDTWLLRYAKEYHNLGAADFKAEFAEYQGQQYTGLQVAYDPGTWVVWLGCSLMVLGIFIAFFMPHKRVWVKIAPGTKGLTAWVAGSTNRNRSTFEDEFERVVAGVKESLAS